MKARARRRGNAEKFRAIVRERSLEVALGIGGRSNVFFARKKRGTLLHVWRRVDAGRQDGLVAPCEKGIGCAWQSEVGEEVDPLSVPIAEVCRVCRKAIVRGEVRL